MKNRYFGRRVTRRHMEALTELHGPANVDASLASDTDWRERNPTCAARFDRWRAELREPKQRDLIEESGD